MKLDLAISPCPNDTYIFYSFTQPSFIDHSIELHFADVEELNRRAIEEQRHAISKLSCFAMAMAEENYNLLGPGGAMGRGCGPLILSTEKKGIGNLETTAIEEILHETPRILIPGKWTTAHLLLRLFLKDHSIDLSHIEFIPERYDRIIERLVRKESRLGLVIHEERFTFQERGLHSFQDLGEFWEKKTKGPLPLGCIAARSDLSADLRAEIESGIRRSIQYSRDHRQVIAPFIKEHAQDKRPEIIQAHIDLYVNEYSLDPGAEGRKALELLLEEARKLRPED